tara:strand:+ start:3700 stop:3963 length:264 start_codon:yes stop_codon:yes gene_type:complete
MTWEDILKRTSATMKEGFELLDKLEEGMDRGTLTLKEANEMVDRIMELRDKSRTFDDYLMDLEREGDDPLFYATKVYEDKTPLEESI